MMETRRDRGKTVPNLEALKISNASISDADNGKVTVFYDGACPLCAREIGFYRERAGAEAVTWLDVSAVEDSEIIPGLSKDQALARFHVLAPEGQLHSGGAAFAQLWQALPGFRLLGRIGQTAPAAWVLNHAYNGFLRLRPRIQAWFRKREGA
ncbi:thiol-disulfide oxidoreductase DCC family protein [Denitrobaculum tricleocarpae]|uniref:DUF393 domain-containing protein n=1 Tax=Denitrobaculum tricleocarpae TaxID=2591009 RepID=A0A545TAX5_9PROT|nr:DUF393 domain-containing protein [Denitrobaculum tricleocarpae]TQV74344.1 DUF393 domain-containing protein [Denitrobaculum tricleocarpae]